MPEPTLLFVVTAAVIVGLVVWVAFVLKTAKEPWQRKDLAPALPAPSADVPLEPSEESKKDEAEEKAETDQEKAEAAAEKAEAEAEAAEKAAAAAEKAAAAKS